jgi:hypothetical protein
MVIDDDWPTRALIGGAIGSIVAAVVAVPVSSCSH